jgi:pentose-5-phosphate-3-epimerase
MSELKAISVCPQREARNRSDVIIKVIKEERKKGGLEIRLKTHIDTQKNYY